MDAVLDVDATDVMGSNYDCDVNVNVCDCKNNLETSECDKYL